MDVFAFREELVAEYARFSRSFAKIRAEDISREVDAAYDGGRFWPAPLIQLNPNFEPGGWIDELVAEGTLDPECEKIFRIKQADDTFGKRLLLHRHQDRRHLHRPTRGKLRSDYRHRLGQVTRLLHPHRR